MKANHLTYGYSSLLALASHIVALTILCVVMLMAENSEPEPEPDDGHCG